MPPVGFEPTISAGERPQTYALDRAASGTGTYIHIPYTIVHTIMYVRLLGSMPVLQEIINTRRWCSVKQTITRQLPLFVPKEAFTIIIINPLNPELNPICYLLALLAHHFLHVSRTRVKSLTIKLLMSYIYICIYIYIYIWSAYS